MRLRALVVGTVSGLLIGGIIVLLRGPLIRPDASPAPLSESGGKIARVVMHYQPEAGPLVAPIYAQFLTAVGSGVEVVWVVGHSSDLDDLKARMGKAWPAGRCRAVVVGKPISTWAKDRCVTLTLPDGGAVLCAPERRQTANPLRTNDQETPYLLAQEHPRLFRVRDSEADFDGGDVLATSRHLFAGPAIIEKNAPGAGARFNSTADLTTHLSRSMGRDITWLGEDPRESPPHHLGMFLTVMGQTAAVGDVRLGEAVAAAHPADIRAALQAAGGTATPAFRADLTARLDRVARQMRALGYTVVRVPLLPSATPRAWMSYNNGIVETRDGNTIFYMPTFGAEALDAAAAHSFRSATGYTVIPIDCAKIWHLGGSLHCLVNVAAREDR